MSPMGLDRASVAAAGGSAILTRFEASMLCTKTASTKRSEQLTTSDHNDPAW